MNEISMPLKKKYLTRGKAPKHTYRTRCGELRS